MGLRSSKPKGASDIDAALERDRAQLATEVKILLIGSGESGKSTLAKQLRRIHQGFTIEQLCAFKAPIFQHVLSSITTLIKQASAFGLLLAPENQVHAQMLLESATIKFTAELVDAILALWNDDGIQQAFVKRSEYQLNDSTAYFMEHLREHTAADYVPSEEDVMHVRAKTTGVLETEIVIPVKKVATTFRLVDVGGQKSERKKWIHLFQDMSAVIFCVALSEYDMMLREDDETNRMQDSLQLFRWVCNLKWFSYTTVILFFNKKDLFEEKIAQVDLNVCFPTYTGGKDAKTALAYIREQFLSMNDNRAKEIFVFETTAVDQESVKKVFTEVTELKLENPFV